MELNRPIKVDKRLVTPGSPLSTTSRMKADSSSPVPAMPRISLPSRISTSIQSLVMPSSGSGLTLMWINCCWRTRSKNHASLGRVLLQQVTELPSLELVPGVVVVVLPVFQQADEIAAVGEVLPEAFHFSERAQFFRLIVGIARPFDQIRRLAHLPRQSHLAQDRLKRPALSYSTCFRHNAGPIPRKCPPPSCAPPVRSGWLIR